jgi:Uri superfamily endonuclease
MDKGIYCLVFRNTSCTLRVGALGTIAFQRGWHIYVGSALGSGGLARLERHTALSRNKDKRPKWHVDYLSGSRSFLLRYTVSALTMERLECRLAAALGGENVPGFGCSDCDCTSHLFFRRRSPVREVANAFRKTGLVPVTATILRGQDREGKL